MAVARYNGGNKDALRLKPMNMLEATSCPPIAVPTMYKDYEDCCDLQLCNSIRMFCRKHAYPIGPCLSGCHTHHTLQPAMLLPNTLSNVSFVLPDYYVPGHTYPTYGQYSAAVVKWYSLIPPPTSSHCNLNALGPQ